MQRWVCTDGGPAIKRQLIKHQPITHHRSASRLKRAVSTIPKHLSSASLSFLKIIFILARCLRLFGSTVNQNLDACVLQEEASAPHTHTQTLVKLQYLLIIILSKLNCASISRRLIRYDPILSVYLHNIPKVLTIFRTVIQ